MMSAAGERLRLVWATLRTIRARLALWYVALLAFTLVGFSAFLVFSLSRSLYAELDDKLQVDARQVTADLDVRRGLPRLGEELPPGALVALYDAEGVRLLGSNTPNPLPDLPTERSQAAEGQQMFSTTALPDSDEWRVLTLRAVTDEGVPAVVEVARPEREVRAALSRLMMEIAVAIPLILLLAVAGGLFLAGRALGPIDRITRAAQSIGAEDLSRRLDLAASPDEVGRLAATFDQMLDRLDRAFRRQQQFTADASHELRTPLALLTTQADVALERPRSPAEYQEALASIRADAAGMRRLLSDLLTLARADAGQEALPREPLALDLLADDVVATMSPLARSRGVRLERGSGESGPIMVAADQTRLTELAVNLVDNALKYTPAGGSVTVSASGERDQAILRVTDTGIGIAAEHLPHLFERFYRIDKARARDEGGSGLGLALCDWIARAHGGSIAVTSQPSEGTTLTVRLPLLPQRPPKRRRARPMASGAVRTPITTEASGRRTS